MANVVDQIKDVFSIITLGLETFSKQTEEQWEIVKDKKRKAF